jgi:hypothetical protein
MALTRDFYIPKASIKIEDSNTDAVAYINDYDDGTKYTAMVFAGKRSKYDKYYSFKTAERRDEYVKQYFEDIADSYESKKKYAEKKKAMAAENQDKYKVGEILYSSWGYDQTNINFYQIVKKTKSMITIEEIGKEYLDTKGASEDLVKPVKNAFIGKEMRKKVGPYGVSISSFEDASLWDGKPKYQTAYGWGR